MSLEEHKPSIEAENEAASIATAALRGTPAAATAALDAGAADDENGQGGASSSAANVIPTEKLAHGMAVAKSFLGSLGSRARKSLEDLNETPAMQKVKEATKPLTTAVVEGAKVVGEAAKPVTTAIVDGARVAGTKLHEGAEAAKPQLEKGLHAVTEAGHKVVDAAKPALAQAGEAIKKLQGKGEGGGEGGGPPPHTV